jgi:hypothetical protein
MAVTWTITNMEYTNDSDKGVVHAAWSASETDGDHTGTVSGMESYTPDASAEGYVAWDYFDESTMVGWVKETLGADECTRVEGKVADQITKSKTPPTSWGIAW